MSTSFGSKCFRGPLAASCSTCRRGYYSADADDADAVARAQLRAQLRYPSCSVKAPFLIVASVVVVSVGALTPVATEGLTLIKGIIQCDGGATMVAVGFCWLATNAVPATRSDTCIEMPMTTTGNFTLSIPTLMTEPMYGRVYAVNAAGKVRYSKPIVLCVSSSSCVNVVTP